MTCIFAAKYGAPLWPKSLPRNSGVPVTPFFWVGGGCEDGVCPAITSDAADETGVPGTIAYLDPIPSRSRDTPRGGAFYEITGKWYTPEDEAISCFVKPENIALAGKATQSSTFSPEEVGVFDEIKAINGIKNQDSRDDLQHTLLQNDPWWRLELGDTYTISDILIYNRFPAYKNRINGFTVSIIRRGVKVWQYTPDAIAGGALSLYHIEVPRIPAARGDEIVVQIPGNGKILHMSEVEVYSYPENARRPSGNNCNTPSTYCRQ